MRVALLMTRALSISAGNFAHPLPAFAGSKPACFASSEVKATRTFFTPFEKSAMAAIASN